MKENIFKGIFVSLAAGMSAYVGEIAIPLIVLLIVVITDYITGMTKAWINKELNSKEGIIGIIKKIAYFLLVGVGVVVDWILKEGLVKLGIDLHFEGLISLLVIIWLIINELISILENLAVIGVPGFTFLNKLIERIKTAVDDKTKI